MKSNVIVFFDGSTYKETSNQVKKIIATYGIVIHQGEEQPIEINGKIELGRDDEGIHELIAFLKTFEYLKSNNINISQVSFNTDCEEISYAHLYLHKDNYYIKKRENIIARLNRAINKLDVNLEPSEIIECLEKSIFNKIKSHTTCIDNIRADYLSKNAYSNKLRLSYEKFLLSVFGSMENFGVDFRNLFFTQDKNKKNTI